MIADLVSLYNLALNAVGKRDSLSATTDKDRGAEVCNLWYPIVRDTVLRAAPWPSCRNASRLALLTKREDAVWDEADPDPGFRYAYAAPSDMLYPRHLSRFERFIVSRGRIVTNVPQAVLVYTYREELVQRWEPSLQMAVVYGLAANIVMPLTGKISRAQGLIEQANALIIGARVEAANEGNDNYETVPDWIRARGYANPGDNRYYHPFGQLLTFAGTPT